MVQGKYVLCPAVLLKRANIVVTINAKIVTAQLQPKNEVSMTDFYLSKVLCSHFHSFCPSDLQFYMEYHNAHEKFSDFINQHLEMLGKNTLFVSKWIKNISDRKNKIHFDGVNNLFFGTNILIINLNLLFI